MKVCQIKDICIGEGKPKVCLPVVGVNEEEILQQIESFKSFQYDLIELRIDFIKIFMMIKKLMIYYIK